MQFPSSQTKSGLLFLFASILFAPTALQSQPWKTHGRLLVNPSSAHRIMHEDGTPFFWFGDTGWEMLHRLSREEISLYLGTRQKQGFNVVQTVILSEFYKNKADNYYGDSLFVTNNPLLFATTPGNKPDNELAYDSWDHVEYALSTAESMGLYIALLPSWGEWVVPREHTAFFNTPKESYEYGWMVASRLRKYPNIIWILGGDRQPDERSNGIDLWRAMAEGIADATNGTKKQDGKADYSSTLMSYHSFNSSSSWFQKDEWIDFHMWGSYHADVNNPRAYELALKDWFLPNPRPTINAEPCYEDHNINYALENNGFFTATDVRTALYWSIFSGSAGFTYGAHEVWQFSDSLRPQYTSIPLKSWKSALALPGARQVILLKKLLESYPAEELVPDQTMLLSAQGTCSSYACCLRGKSYAFVYIPTGISPEVKGGVISGEKVKASWFDPRTGKRIPIGLSKNTDNLQYMVPGISPGLSWLRAGRGCDWVLILEDASKY